LNPYGSNSIDPPPAYNSLIGDQINKKYSLDPEDRSKNYLRNVFSTTLYVTSERKTAILILREGEGSRYFAVNDYKHQCLLQGCTAVCNSHPLLLYILFTIS
jgi:hypothetical protein